MVFRSRFRRSLVSADPIYVFTMPKVGSKTIQHSLGAAWPGTVFHGHAFDPDIRDWQVTSLRRHFDSGGRLNVISLVRLPVSRNVSHFFQDLDDDDRADMDRMPTTVQQARERFMQEYDHGFAERFFDRHFKENLGIDVYQHPFPEQGHATFESGNVRLIMLKSELPDVGKSQAIAGFLGVDEFPIVNVNIGSQKRYSSLYSQFRKQGNLDRRYVTEICNSRYARHFYGDDELALESSRWCSSSDA